MIVYVVELSYERRSRDHWQIAGVYKSIDGAKNDAEKAQESPLMWEKQLTSIAVGDWWLATTRDEWGRLWRIIQLNLLD